MAIMYCPGHKKENRPISEGKRKADKTACRVALEIWPLTSLIVLDLGDPTLLNWLKNTTEDVIWASVIRDGGRQETSNQLYQRKWVYAYNKRSIIHTLMSKRIQNLICHCHIRIRDAD